MNRTKASTIVNDFFADMNPSLWNGSTSMPKSFDNRAWQYPLTDDVNLEITFVSTSSVAHSNKRPQLYEVVAIIGELQGYEDYFLSNCLINNKEYLIYFYPQYITNALQEAIRLKKATNIYVYKKEKNILFYKLAAPKK